MARVNTQQPIVADFEVKINGSPLPARIAPYLIGITVDKSVGVPSMFELELAAADQPEEEILFIDDALFSIGNEVEIRMGYTEERETVIIGEITALEPAFSFDRLPSLTIRGYDLRHRMQRGRKTRTFLQQKDSDIATLLANEAGMQPDVQDSGVVHEYILQANQSDLAFLQARARLIHFEIGVEGKKLIFRPVANAGAEQATLTPEGDLLTFSPRLSIAAQVDGFSARGWDWRKKQAIIGKAKTNDVNGTMAGQKSGPAAGRQAFGSAADQSSTQPVDSQGEADQLARGALNATALGFIEGEGVCWGRTDLRPGGVLKIEGIGNRFSGLYYLQSVTHVYSAQDGYRTHFQVRRNAS